MPIYRSVILFTVCTIALGACTKKKPDPIDLIPQEHVQKAHQRLIARWDYNGDGSATCADVLTLRKEQFAKLDTDHNGSLDLDEYRNVNFEDKSFVFHSFTKLDNDVSASISPTEFNAVSHSEFRGVDKDNNCIISERDAAYNVVNARQKGHRSKGQSKPKDRPNKRRDTEDIDPFE